MSLILGHVWHFATPIPIEEAALSQHRPDGLCKHSAARPSILHQTAHAEVMKEAAQTKAKAQSNKLASALLPKLEGIHLDVIPRVAVDLHEQVYEPFADPSSAAFFMVLAAKPQMGPEVGVAREFEFLSIPFKH